MNYRHHFHAGNFADVFKHSLLIQLVRAVQRKPGGALFLDTHAGWGGYDLNRAAQGDSRPRPPEHPDGIGRLWSQPGLLPALAEYVAIVREYQKSAGVATDGAPIRYYPGSPWLLARSARAQDRTALFEIDPAAVEALRSELVAFRRLTIQAGDGYGAVAALLPPPERRALVLIDPPYEAAEEWQRVESVLQLGLRRLPGGVYAVWYPLTVRAGSEDFLQRLEASALAPTLAVEIVVDPAATMRGCGLVMVNPPWRFEIDAQAWMAQLSALLGRASGSAASWRWLVPEKPARP
jgi:23S rRNA (adenine2030-N6)-methyltransferase